MYLTKNRFPLAVRAIALCCACFLLLTCADMFLPGTERNVFDNLVRLHVVAQSDGEFDQSLKLLVRDAVVERFGAAFAAETSVDGALALINANLDALRDTADEVLSSHGAPYLSKVELVREEYPRREYGSFTLPEGVYYSLRILLGEADGQNWWCVLFPPLCFGGGIQSFDRAGIDDNGKRVFGTKKYRFRFRFLELFW